MMMSSSAFSRCLFRTGSFQWQISVSILVCKNHRFSYRAINVWKLTSFQECARQQGLEVAMPLLNWHTPILPERCKQQTDIELTRAIRAKERQEKSGEYDNRRREFIARLPFKLLTNFRYDAIGKQKGKSNQLISNCAIDSLSVMWKGRPGFVHQP